MTQGRRVLVLGGRFGGLQAALHVDRSLLVNLNGAAEDDGKVQS